MKLKKLLCGLMILCMILTLLPINVYADDAFPDLTFQVEKKAATDTGKIYLESTLEGLTLQDPGDQYYLESEPNDTLSDANVIYHDYTVEGDISGTDSDAFIFKLNSASQVTVISVCSTEGLIYAIYDIAADEFVAECEYLGYDEETGLYQDGLVCELPAGTYCLVFLDYYEDYLQYVFYLDIHTHNYTAVVTEPDCHVEGYTTYTCSCGDSYVSDYTEPLGCDMDDGTVLSEPTVDQAGMIEYKCKRCTCCFYSMSLHHRISGPDRCQTAIAAANELKAALGISKFDTIILASGNNFADALAGSYLAAVKNAPILLYRASAVALNQEYIEQNLSGNGIVYLLGGSSAIPEQAKTDLEAAGITVQRLSGETRFDTNLKILETAGVSDGQEILVATGHNFADSLSASATGLPILLVNNKTGKLTSKQQDFLNSIDGASLTIIGGTSAVSDQLANTLSDYAPVTRLSGSTRYETSIKVAQKYFNSPKSMMLAYAKNFPDGLCGGPLAHAYGIPLLLTDDNHWEITAEYVHEIAFAHNTEIIAGHVLGGRSLISDGAAHSIFSTMH